MKRLGYTRFVAQGGDWGAVVVDLMGVQAPAGAARHPHQHARRDPAETSSNASFSRQPRRRPVSPPRSERVRAAAHVLREARRLRPRDGDAPADAVRDRGLARRPGGLPARPRRRERSARHRSRGRSTDVERPSGLTRDDVLDNITLYWLTNTGVSSARLYWENKLPFFVAKGVKIPVARERLPRRALPGAAELGGAGVPQAHLLQRASTRAATSPPGSSRSCSPKRSARRSGRCASDDRCSNVCTCPRSPGRPSGSTPSHSAPPSCGATSSW